MDLHPLMDDALFRVILVPLLVLHCRALKSIDLGIVGGPTGKRHCVSGCCQSNANQSPKGAKSGSSGRKPTPFGQSGGTVLLENVTAVEMAVVIELVVDRGMGRSKFL